MGFVQLGEISTSLLYPLGMCVTCIINVITQSILLSTDFSKHPFFLVWLMFLGEASNIIIYIIQRLRTPNKDTHQYDKKLKVNQTGILPRKNKCTVILIIICLFVLDTTTSLILFITRGDRCELRGELLMKLFSTLLTVFLTILVLKYKYYKHHIIGLIIVSVALISMTIVDVVVYKEEKCSDEKFSIPVMVILFLTYLFSSVQEVFEKYLIDIKFVNPFALLAFEGLGGLITTSCLLLVFSYVGCVFSDISEISSICETDFRGTWKLIFGNKEILILILIMYVSIAIFNSFRILTNQHYTPTHRSISDSIASFLAWILKLTIPYFNTTVKDKEDYIKNTIIGILYVIMIIGVLIFLEIIILTFCGLDRNTKEKINARQEFFGVNNTILPVTDNEESEDEKSQDISTLY